MTASTVGFCHPVSPFKTGTRVRVQGWFGEVYQVTNTRMNVISQHGRVYSGYACDRYPLGIKVFSVSALFVPLDLRHLTSEEFTAYIDTMSRLNSSELFHEQMIDVLRCRVVSCP